MKWIFILLLLGSMASAKAQRLVSDLTAAGAVDAMSAKADGPVPQLVPKSLPVTGWTTVGNFQFSGSVTKATLAAGQVQSAKVSVKATTAISGLIVGIKFLDSKGSNLLEKAAPAVDFAAGEQKEFRLDFGLRGDAPGGTYSVGLGLWTSNYASTLVYFPHLVTYRVTAVAQPTPAVAAMPPNTLTMASAADIFLLRAKQSVGQHRPRAGILLRAFRYWSFDCETFNFRKMELEIPDWA